MSTCPGPGSIRSGPRQPELREAQDEQQAQPSPETSQQQSDALAQAERQAVDTQAPAIKVGSVHVVERKHFTTLSFWNIVGAEDLARILWPDDFPDPRVQILSLAD